MESCLTAAGQNGSLERGGWGTSGRATGGWALLGEIITVVVSGRLGTGDAMYSFEPMYSVSLSLPSMGSRSEDEDEEVLDDEVGERVNLSLPLPKPLTASKLLGSKHVPAYSSSYDELGSTHQA